MRYMKLHRQLKHEVPELNITAFMNLMVILVPFLLMTMVFSHTTILDLNLPQASSSQAALDKPRLQLEITLRAASLDVGDRQRGLIKRIDNTAAGYDLDTLAGLLMDIKQQYPAVSDATLLLEPSIPYDQLVQVMDQVRFMRQQQDNLEQQVLLFPDIAIGDAS